MKKMTVFIGSILATQAYAQDITPKSSLEQQVSYSFGYGMAKNNTEVFQDLDIKAFLVGFQAALAGKDASLNTEEMATALTQYRQKNEAKTLIELQKIAAQNAQKSQDFLTKNLKSEHIKVTKSGLQYQILTETRGKKPKASSTVTVHYEGRLLDQTVFDSSLARQKPAEFQVSKLIPGWTEGLQLMSPGSKYRFFIPSHLAYGEMGSGDAIGPNNALIFDVELLKINN